MISNLDNLASGLEERDRRIRGQSIDCFLNIVRRFCAPFPKEEPFEWCVRELVLNDADTKGQFNPVGREYLRDIINDNDAVDVRQQTVINGTGTGKTLSTLAGIAWKIKHRPCRGLMVMPATKGAGGCESFVMTRLIPALKASPAVRDLFPDGQERFFLNSKKVRFNGAHFDFVGANSTGQLGSNRCGDVRLDEADKYRGRLGNEAGTDSLAMERTEGVEDYQIFRNTTPTIETAIGWQKLLQSNFQRRFLPCPHCNSELRGVKVDDFGRRMITDFKGWFDLAWATPKEGSRVENRGEGKPGAGFEPFCVLPDKLADGTVLPRAYTAWDLDARRRDGSWDLQRVFNSARFICPHCGGHVRDEHQVWGDKNGVWVPLQTGFMLHKGYHLSSLYAPVLAGNEKSTLGGRALKYLEAVEDGQIKGFINSTLAEVDVMQAFGKSSIELTSHPIAQTDWVAQLTADFQKNWPYLWFVVRKWSAFKLLPPFAITNGRPEFVAMLELEENRDVREICLKLAGEDSKAWTVIAELMRFDSRTGRSPVIDFLLAQDLTGEKLVKFYWETAGGDTLEFRRALYREMSLALHGDANRLRCHRGGDSELAAAGHLALSGEYIWDELKEIIQEYQVGKGMSIPEHCVAIDCGYAEKFNREVLRKCYESATEFKFYDPLSKNRPPIFYRQPIHNACLTAPRNGWLAVKGYPMNQRWNHGGIRNELNLNLEDPFFGTALAGTSVTEVLELPSGVFWLRKEDLRQKRTKQFYGVSPEVEWFPKVRSADGSILMDGGRRLSNFKLEDYQKQLNEQFYDEARGKVEPKHGRGGAQSRAHPYHLDDCEVYQIALATHNEFFEETGKK